MAASKTHTLYIRGLSKEKKNYIKKIAKENRRSVNSEILDLIDKALVAGNLKIKTN